jgi:hypothetical protein
MATVDVVSIVGTKNSWHARGTMHSKAVNVSFQLAATNNGAFGRASRASECSVLNLCDTWTPSWLQSCERTNWLGEGRQYRMEERQ